jgi:nickel-dependent lactate racemase
MVTYTPKWSYWGKRSIIPSSQSKRIRIQYEMPTNRVTRIIGLQLTMTSLINSSPYRRSEVETNQVVEVHFSLNIVMF